MKRLLILAALLCGSAQAQFRTGNQLLTETQEPASYRSGLAMGYIMGVTDAGNGVNFCPPSNVTAGQISDMVRNRLFDTPAIRHLPADIIIYSILEPVWPCAKKRGGAI